MQYTRLCFSCWTVTSKLFIKLIKRRAPLVTSRPPDWTNLTNAGHIHAPITAESYVMPGIFLLYCMLHSGGTFLSHTADLHAESSVNQAQNSFNYRQYQCQRIVFRTRQKKKINMQLYIRCQKISFGMRWQFSEVTSVQFMFHGTFSLHNFFLF